MNGHRIASLCSGYEGLGMAVQAVIGGELVFVADNDPGAAKILAYHYPDVPNLGDITTTDWTAVPPVDVLTAGFPCQDISLAGKRAGLRKGNRSGIWAQVAEAIDALRPSLVVLENVRSLTSAEADSDVEPCSWCMGDGGDQPVLRALGAVLGDLADLGFDAEWVCLGADDAGAPHRRKRIFITAWPAENADCATGRERRIAAPGQAAGRWSRADTGRPGGTPAAADAIGAGLEVRGVEHHGPQRPAAERSSAELPAPDPAGDGRDEGRTEPARLIRGLDAAVRSDAAADTDSDGLARGQECDSEPQRGQAGHEQRRVDPLRRVLDWGNYAPAIRRWEAVTGRPAPRPTEPGRTGERLSPRFVEFLMGLPDGWVTDVPGLSRNAQLHALGNGVVPQQAAMALRMLLARTETAVAA